MALNCERYGQSEQHRRRAKIPDGGGGGTYEKRRRAREIKKLKCYKNNGVKKAERA